MLPQVFAYLSPAAFPGVLVPGSQERDAGQAPSRLRPSCLQTRPICSRSTVPPRTAVQCAPQPACTSGFYKVTEAVKTAV